MQLVDCVCRPPRDNQYSDRDLIGGTRATFSFAPQRGMPIRKYYREDIDLKNAKGEILKCSHYRPCVQQHLQAPCVIYCHSNSGSRKDAAEIIFSLLPHNMTVFSLDFSGSGLSGGNWVTLGAHEVDDLETAVSYLRTECPHVSTIGLWGRSMGAVTALLYSHRDPSIAGVVADSPFSQLKDLMLEIATNKEQGLSIPRPFARMVLSLMKRSVRRRAGFSITSVSPERVMPETYTPTLFGHGKEDGFIGVHHSEKLFVAHGSEHKSFVSFEGDHNSVRPEYWYESGLTFLLDTLFVESDRVESSPSPVTQQQEDVNEEGVNLSPEDVVRSAQRIRSPPWDVHTLMSIAGSEFQNEDDDDDEALQKALALSLSMAQEEEEEEERDT